MTRSEPSAERLRIGVIDVGSNSVRLVVFERFGCALQPLYNEKVLCGLASGLAETGRLDPEGVRRALTSLRRYAGIARAMGLDRLDVFGTEAVRAAEDGAAFVDMIRDETGLEMDVLSGEAEARLAALGVMAAEPSADGLVGDLGGGSLELVRIEGGECRSHATLPLGPLVARRLKKRADLAAMIDEQLASVPWLGECRGAALYPVGGAWRSFAKAQMAQKAYPLRIIHHYQLAGPEALAYAELIASLGKGSLQRLRDVSRRRRDTLPYGALVLERLLRKVTPKEVIFSAFGAREGLIFDRTGPCAGDPLIDFARMLGHQYGRVPPEGEALAEWIAPLFAERAAAPERWRRAVCWLGDIAGRDHPDYRADHAFYRALRMPCVGIDHPGRIYLGIALHTRYAGTGDDTLSAPFLGLIDDQQRSEAVLLGLALRLAFAVSPGGRDMLGRTRLRLTGKQLELVVDPAGVGLDGEAVGRRLTDLAGAGGWTGSVVAD